MNFKHASLLSRMEGLMIVVITWLVSVKEVYAFIPS